MSVNFVVVVVAAVAVAVAAAAPAAVVVVIVVPVHQTSDFQHGVETMHMLACTWA